MTFDRSVSAAGVFDLLEESITFDKLSNSVLVAIEEAGFSESDLELRAVGVWSIVDHSEDTSLVMSSLEVLVWKSSAASTKVLFFVEVPTCNSEAWGSSGKRCSNVGSVLVSGSSAECLEVECKSWGSVIIQLKN